MRYAKIAAYTGYLLDCVACDIHEGVGGEIACSREEALRVLREHNSEPWHKENIRQLKEATDDDA